MRSVSASDAYSSAKAASNISDSSISAVGPSTGRAVAGARTDECYAAELGNAEAWEWAGRWGSTGP